MGFAPDERAALLAAKFVGPTVIQRLEALGLASFAELAAAEADAVCRMTAAALGSSCWANSPQARRAVANAIAVAREYPPG